MVLVELEEAEVELEEAEVELEEAEDAIDGSDTMKNQAILEREV